MAKNLVDLYSPEKFKEQGHLLIDMIANLLTDQDNRKTLEYKDPENQYQFWKSDSEHLSDDPLELFSKVIDRSINIHNKKYMGHQIAVTPPITMLSSMIIALLNNGMGVYEMGMTGNSMEKVVIENIIGHIELDNNASGFVVTGGTVGNLTALLAARAALTDIWNKGNENKQYAILVSADAHYCIDRAARIMGLGEDAIIKIPVNDKYQLDISQLQNAYDLAVSQNRTILCCIGCACTTATGAYDDLESIGDFCKKNNIWFHVDGAHGGPAIYSKKYKHLLKGIQMADSVIIDFHKMMMTPSLSTALVFKSTSNSFKTFSQEAHYLWTDQQQHNWFNSGMRTLECTKSMSILNVYSLFKLYGEAIFEENINTLFGLAITLTDLINKKPGFELPVLPQSNIVCFRYIIPGTDANKLNAFIRKSIIEEGEFYIVQTSLNNNTYLRVSLMNPFTTHLELESLLDKIQHFANQFDNN